jgi:hypothetical protein
MPLMRKISSIPCNTSSSTVAPVADLKQVKPRANGRVSVAADVNFSAAALRHLRRARQ